MTRESKMQDFGIKLYEARKKYAQDNPDKRATQGAIGFLIGVTGTTISSWERGATFPSKANYEKLVELFPWLDTTPHRKLIAAKTASTSGPKNPKSNKDMRQKSNGKRHTVEPMPAGATTKVSTDANKPEEITFQGWSLARINGEVEPRIPDFVEAERLGYDQARDIRKLIKRNEEEIRRHGWLEPRATVARGRNQYGETGATASVDVYYLNEDQALLVAMLSRTEKAADVRYEIIQVYKAWRKGLSQKPADLAVSQSYALLSDKLALGFETLSDALDIKFDSKFDQFMDVVERAIHGQGQKIDQLMKAKPPSPELIFESVMQAKADQNGWVHIGHGFYQHRDGRKAVGANALLKKFLRQDFTLVPALRAFQGLKENAHPRFPALNQLGWLAQLAGIKRESLPRADIKEDENVMHLAYPDPSSDWEAYTHLRGAIMVWGAYGGCSFEDVEGFGKYFNRKDAAKRLVETFNLAGLDARLKYADDLAARTLINKPQ